MKERSWGSDWLKALSGLYLPPAAGGQDLVERANFRVKVIGFQGPEPGPKKNLPDEDRMAHRRYGSKGLDAKGMNNADQKSLRRKSASQDLDG